MTGTTHTHDGESGDARRSRVRGGAAGAVAAACGVCCAAPAIGLFSIGFTGAAATAFATVFAGLVFGLVVAAATVASVVVRRRQSRLAACSPTAAPRATGPVPVELGTRPERP